LSRVSSTSRVVFGVLALGLVLWLPAAARAASASANLAITVTDSPDPVKAGGAITYSIAITNSGPDTASNVGFDSNTPTGTTFTQIQSGFSLDQPCTKPGIGQSGAISCRLGFPLSSGQTWNLTFIVTVNQAGPPASTTVTVNTSSGTFDPSGLNNVDTETTTVTGTASANVSITVTDSPDPVKAGGAITYSIGVTNNGPDTVSNLGFDANTPTGTTFTQIQSGFSLDQPCTKPGIGQSGAISCRLGFPLGSGQTWNLTFIVTVNQAAPPASTTVTVNASSGTPDPVGGNNSDMETTTVTGAASANVGITVTDSPDPVKAGGAITYSIGVTNNGPDTVSNLGFDANTPTGTTFTQIQSGFSLDQPCTKPGIGQSGAISCRLGFPLGAGQTWNLTFIVTVNQAAPPASTTVTVNASSGTPDPVAGNNSDMETTTVTGAASANVAITVTDSPDPVKPGGAITYSIAITNNGPDTVANLGFDANTPTGTSFTGLQSGFSLDQPCTKPGIGQSGAISCRLGFPLGSAQTWNLTLIVTVTHIAPPASTTITVNASSGTPDPVAGNNSDMETTTIESVTTAVALRSFAARRTADGIVVSWRTGSEVRLLGFDVYRSTATGLTRLNRGLIAARAGVAGGSYRFVDRTAPQAGRVAYRMRAVYGDGTRVWIGSTALHR
jgi:uncharacterized repeat protein (TIGR01451 family)